MDGVAGPSVHHAVGGSADQSGGGGFLPGQVLGLYLRQVEVQDVAIFGAPVTTTAPTDVSWLTTATRRPKSRYICRVV